MSAFTNVIQWYENKALDNPELRSPTPCPRGIYCQYKLPNKETKELELACCRMVHPGEEGNGRRLFPARTAPDGREQQACVRLTGKAGFYERCRLKQPWRVWAAEHGIPLPPADIPWVQVVRGPIQRGPIQRAPKGVLVVMDEIDYSSANVSARAASAVEWPSLQNRVVPPPSLNLGVVCAGPSTLEAPSPMITCTTRSRLEAPSPLLPRCEPLPPLMRPEPPQRLDFSGGGGGGSSLRLPPEIVRYAPPPLDEEEEDEEDGCASPCLLSAPTVLTRSDRIQERVQALCDKGMNFEDALHAAATAVDAEIEAERGEGAMDGVN